MGWTNIKDEVLPRIGKLAGILNISDREAAGTVYMLWRESQDILAIEGSRDEILDWAHLYGLEEGVESKWLSALERARLISKTKHGTYRIHGNDIEIDSKVSRIKQSTKGGEATKAKWEAIRKANEGRTPADAMPDASATLAQFNARQGNTNQTTTRQSKAVGEATPTAAETKLYLDFHDFIGDVHYTAVRAWLSAYGEDLIREQVPLCRAKWASHPKRNQQGEKPLFINSWFYKAQSQRDSTARAGPRAEIDTVALITKHEAQKRTGAK